ncbi:hypothetical protein [Bathymodiolus platifrons methanotrophic gill symbiont]|uniref:hypothetical protein n=1 Tax=Bathymodiolus platifrons methanotrophic gill symbiont TaxID=113268 RepID=UPI003B848267
MQKNTGTGQATGVTLEDHLPGNVTFVSATGGGTASGSIVSWNTGAPCYLTKFRDSCRRNSFTYAANRRCSSRPASATD